MSDTVEITTETGTITVLVPLRYRKRGGRKVVIGEVRSARDPNPAPPQDSAHKTILKALGRAYRWKRMMESGEFNSITDLAAAEKINHAYVRRILRLTLLSPTLTEAILGDGSPKGFRLHDLLKNSAVFWTVQKELLR